MKGEAMWEVIKFILIIFIIKFNRDYAFKRIDELGDIDVSGLDEQEIAKLEERELAKHKVSFNIAMYLGLTFAMLILDLKIGLVMHAIFAVVYFYKAIQIRDRYPLASAVKTFLLLSLPSIGVLVLWLTGIL